MSSLQQIDLRPRLERKYYPIRCTHLVFDSLPFLLWSPSKPSRIRLSINPVFYFSITFVGNMRETAVKAPRKGNMNFPRCIRRTRIANISDFRLIYSRSQSDEPVDLVENNVTFFLSVLWTKRGNSLIHIFYGEDNDIRKKAVTNGHDRVSVFQAVDMVHNQTLAAHPHELLDIKTSFVPFPCPVLNAIVNIFGQVETPSNNKMCLSTKSQNNSWHPKIKIFGL